MLGSATFSHVRNGDFNGFSGVRRTGTGWDGSSAFLLRTTAFLAAAEMMIDENLVF